MKMKFLSAIFITHLGAAWAAALPPNLDNRQLYQPCPDGLYKESLCCERDVLGIQDIKYVIHSPSFLPCPFLQNFLDVS